MFNLKPKKMYRTDTLKRYTQFLNGLKEVQESAGYLTNLTAQAKSAGVSQTLISFMKDQQILTPIPEGWKFKDLVRWSDEQVSTLISDFNRWKRMRRENRTYTNGLDIKSPLADITTNDLLKELKRRGYSGRLLITKEIDL